MKSTLKIFAIGCGSLILLGFISLFLMMKFVGDAQNTDGITRLSDYYGKKDSKVYHFTYGYHMGIKKELAADENTFRDLGSEYAKDKDTVFYAGKIIQDAEPTTFVILDSLYRISKDRNNVYLHEKQLTGEDPKEFDVKEYISEKYN